MKVIVLYNLPGTGSTLDITQADDDTQKSAGEVAAGLKEIGYEVEVEGIKKEEIGRLKDLAMKSDFVFNLVEWSGRDSIYGIKVIEELQRAGVPYSGSNAWGYRVSCDKILMKKLFNKFGIPTPNYQVFSLHGSVLKSRIRFPVIVKPVYEHCGIGVSQKSVVENKDDLRFMIHDLLERYEQPALVEEFIDGYEAHMTVLSKKGKPWVLPPAVLEFEKKPGYRPILTYESKWIGGWEEKMSSWKDDISPLLIRKLNRVAVVCNNLLGGRSYSRIDMRVRDGKVYVLEINNNPGIDFDPTSGIAYSAKKVGLSWHGLLENIVTEAYEESKAYVPAFA